MLDTSKLFDAAGGRESDLPDEDIISRFTDEDRIDFPIEMTDLDMWANYLDEDLYVMDSKLREFLKKTRYRRAKNNGYRTTCSVVFAWIYGRKPEPRDSRTCRLLHQLLLYYCTSYTGRTTYAGKPVNRVYEFSKYATEKKRPYSLKLRMEENENGKDPFRRRDVDPATKRKRHRGRGHSEDGES